MVPGFGIGERFGSGKEQKISITGSSGLTKGEVEKLRKDAEAHAEEDRQAREAAEARNNADNLAYQSEKQLRDLGDKLSADQKQAVEDAIKNVREKLNGNDVEAIKQASDDLQNRFQNISAELYKQAASQTSPQTGGGAPRSAEERGTTGRDDNVVDADFEVVDEKRTKCCPNRRNHDTDFEGSHSSRRARRSGYPGCGWKELSSVSKFDPRTN